MTHLKDKIKPKADWRNVDSPKKTNGHICFVCFFTLHRKKRSNSSVHFLGESTARQFAFRFYLNFSRVTNKRRLSGFRFFESSVVDNSNIFFSVISEIQNSTPALTKFYKLKHFIPTEFWVDSNLFQVIKL